MNIYYYDQPIKTCVIDGFSIEYCRWGKKGIRLLYVDKRPHSQLSNYEFMLFMEKVLDLEALS